MPHSAVRVTCDNGMISSVGSTTESDPSLALASDVAEGLRQDPKRIPSRYLYDALGSRLFEAICRLPWYKITRGESALLERQGPAILADFRAPPTVIELGAGSGEKLSLLFGLGGQPASTRVHLVDISPAALTLSTRTLSLHPGVEVVTHEATYQDGLTMALSQTDRDRPAIVILLGSNIGNMARAESDQFLQEIWSGCRPGDRFLLGADLVKSEAELRLAYDDPLGVTAAFTKNLLLRLNRELDGDFEVDAFDYHVVWNDQVSRVESYLVSRVEQVVCLRGAGCCIRLAEGESIWVESSHKYSAETVVAMGRNAGFSLRQQWIDPESRFALTLFDA
jgi:L-histidine N-alpha-methyltransferase